MEFNSLNEIERIEIENCKQQLRTQNAKTRVGVVFKLGLLGGLLSSDANKALVGCLDDKSIKVRHVAVIFAQNKEIPGVEQKLLKLLHDKKNYIRERAIERLGEMECELAVDDLLSFFNDRNESMSLRLQAAIALVNIRNEKAESFLLDIASNTNTDVLTRTLALAAIGSINSAKAEKILVNALQDENEHIQEVSLESLARRDSYRSVKILVDIFKDDQRSAHIREYAGRQLSHIDTEKSLLALLNLLTNEDEDKQVRTVAAVALFRTQHMAIRILILVLKNFF